MDLEYIKQKVNNILSSFLEVEPVTYNSSTIINMVSLVQKRKLTDVMERLYDALTRECLAENRVQFTILIINAYFSIFSVFQL